MLTNQGRFLSCPTKQLIVFLRQSQFLRFFSNPWCSLGIFSLLRSYCKYLDIWLGLVRYLDLFWIFGLVLDIWTCSGYLGLFCIFGLVLNIRTCSEYLDLFWIFALVLNIWTCSEYLDLFCIFGRVVNIWTCSVDLFWIFGLVLNFLCES